MNMIFLMKRQTHYNLNTIVVGAWLLKLEPVLFRDYVNVPADTDLYEIDNSHELKQEWFSD